MNTMSRDDQTGARVRNCSVGVTRLSASKLTIISSQKIGKLNAENLSLKEKLIDKDLHIESLRVFCLEKDQQNKRLKRQCRNQQIKMRNQRLKCEDIEDEITNICLTSTRGTNPVSRISVNSCFDRKEAEIDRLKDLCRTQTEKLESLQEKCLDKDIEIESLARFCLDNEERFSEQERQMKALNICSLERPSDCDKYMSTV